MANLNEQLSLDAGRFLTPSPAADVGDFTTTVEPTIRPGSLLGFVDTPDLPAPSPGGLELPPEMAEMLEASGIRITLGGPGFGDVLNAEMELSNEIASLGASESNAFLADEYDPNFDLLGALRGTRYEGNPELFVHARNQRHFDAMVRDIEREEANRLTLERATSAQWWPAMLLAQLASPINLLSLGGGLAARQGARGGYSLLARAGLLGGGVATDTALQEAILRGTQHTRTVGETVANIGGSFVLGSVLGYGALRLLDVAERRAFEARIEQELVVPHLDSPDPFEPGAFVGNLTGDTASLSAALARQGADDYTVKSALGVDRIFKQGPLGRTAHSESRKVRQVVNELAESPYWYRENVEGVEVASLGSRKGQPQAVETRVKLYDWPLAASSKAITDAFTRYRLGRAKQFGDILRLQIQDRLGDWRGTRQDYNEMQFRRMVGDAINSGLVHEIPEVQEAARFVYETFIKPIEADAVTRGFVKLDKDGKTPSLARSYIVEKIVREQARFKEIVKAHLYRRRTDFENELRDREVATLDAQGRLEAAGRQRVVDLDEVRRLQTEEREIGQLRDDAEAAAAGERTARYTALSLTDADVEGIVGMWRHVRQMRQARKPESLSSFVVRGGGVEDPGGDVMAMVGSNRGRPGLIRRAPDDSPQLAGLGTRGSSGYSLDDWALRAWESGFFPEHTERPDINAFLERLGDDLVTGRVVREADAEWADNMAVAAGMEEELASYGVTARRFTKEETLREYFGTERQRGAGAPGTDARAAPSVGERIGRTPEGKRAARLAEKAERADSYVRMRANMVDAEIDTLADDVVNRITMRKAGQLTYDLHLNRDGQGLVEEDEILEGADFNFNYGEVRDYVRRDAELLMGLMRHTLVPDIEIANRFGRVDMAVQIKEIQAEYGRRIDAASRENPALAGDIEKRMRRDIADIVGMRDRIAHRYGIPDDPAAWYVRGSRVMRDYNIVSKLGLVTLSSISDVGKLIWTRGMGGLLADGLVPLLSNTSEMVAAMRDAQHMSAGLDMILNSRAIAFSEATPEWGGNMNGIDRVSRDASRVFMKAALLPAWNGFMKQLSGVLVSKTILEAAEAVAKGAAKPRQIENLARLGISTENARIIAEQSAKHGTRVRRVWRANADGWDIDATPAGQAVRAAREALYGAVRKDVDAIIVTPGQEMPLMMSKEQVKFVTQFQSFAVSSIDRTLIAGLQQRDMAVLNGMIAMFVFAMIGNEIRRAAFPRADRREKSFSERWADPAERNQMMLDALDRAGIFGWLHLVDRVLTRAGGIGTSNILGTGEYRRMGNAGLLGMLAGPGVGTVENLVKTGFAIGDEISGRAPWRVGDTRRLQRLVPFIGLGYMRFLIEQAGGVDAFNRAMDAQQGRSRR